jgi:phosphohistidine phosphatase
MLRLTLFRHGKSSWDDVDINDFERPLAPRGLRDVPEMGRRLAALGKPPALIISSPARRALSTARAIAREVDCREERIVEEPGLYLAAPQQILAILQGAADAPDHILLVGHNPGFTDLANMLDDVRINNMPTAAMLIVEFDVPRWADIIPAQARFIAFDYPKKRPA